ncbi:MAG: glycosyltransferase family 1 protein [Bacillota bacterium]|nr:glycosyltransferase family 1 protein [Bacillota bacterium]
MGNPLRILHVVVNMNRGGAETLIMNLYRNIDRTKIQFDFLTCKKGDFDQEINRLGGKVYRIPYVTDIGHFQYLKRLNEFFLINNHYKIVHSHMDRMSGFVLWAAKKAGISHRISHSHNTSSEGGLAVRTYKWFAGQFIIPNATNLFACSSDAAKWLFKERSNSSIILKNGIESNRFEFSQGIRNQVRDELQLSPHTFVVGHVGRFNVQKNHSFLLDIFADFHRKHSDSILLLIGDGELKREIEKKIRNLNLVGRVKLLGVREDIYKILQAMDVFVFPSIHEGLPVSLIEAQGAGLPCIISDKISSEADLGMGLVQYFSLGDKNNWVSKLTKIASKHIDRLSVSHLLAKRGFDIREAANYLEQFYSKITG